MLRRLLVICIPLMIGTVVLALAQDAPPSEVEQLRVDVLNIYPHDPHAFTQGLLLYEGELYESTGNCCPSYTLQSDIRRVDIETGHPLAATPLSQDYFAEGLALVDDRLIQLTWKEKTAFVYDVETFALIDSFHYLSEGWGLCYDGDQLFMSDGSPLIVTRDPDTFAVTGGFPVIYQNDVVFNINELECVGDYLYANVWFDNRILKIDKDNGQVVGVVDATGLLASANLTDEELSAYNPSSHVLNGIAYNPESDTFYIAGKDWPRLFEVRFVPIDD
jgi:glutaminyl-peptide cyclotransferase